jgi:hypothetical protein
MVNLGTIKLAGVIITLGIVVMAGTNLSFAQNATSTSTPTNTTPTGTVDYPCAATPFYGAQAFAYIACTPLSTGELYGAIAVAAIVALAIGCGVHGRKYHTPPPT